MVVKLQREPWKDVADVKCWPRLAVDLVTYILSTADDIKTEKARLVLIEKTFEQMLTRVRDQKCRLMQAFKRKIAEQIAANFKSVKKRSHSNKKGKPPRLKYQQQPECAQHQVQCNRSRPLKSPWLQP